MAEARAEAATLYERDFFDWTREQADLLRRAGAMRLNDLPGLDWERLAEEIEDLGKALRRELFSRYRVLVLHLLKWRHQPTRRGPSWRRTIREQRDELGELVRRNPSLRPRRPAELGIAYPRARVGAADETGLPLATFPEACPFTLDQIEDHTFWPEPDA